MKLSSENISEKVRIEICLLNFVIFFFLYRTAVPLFKYPFLVLFFIFFIYTISNYKSNIIISLKFLFRDFLLLNILILIFFISFVLSDKIHLSVFKDLFNILILLSLFFILTLVVTSKLKVRYFTKSFLSISIFFAFIISILGLSDILDIFHYTDYFSTYDASFLDYNFSLLPVFFGIISIFYFLTSTVKRPLKIILNFLLLLFSLRIFLSGSRRGIILLAIIFILLAVTIIVAKLTKREHLKVFASNSKIFILSIFFSPVIFYLFVFHTSYEFKDKSLKLFGTESGYVAKKKITWSIFRYISIFNKNLSVSELYKKTWSISFDPLDPENGWGEGVFSTIFPLTGRNVEIVPFGAKGYLLDNRCIYTSSDHHAYSNTLIGNSKVNKGDVVQASVFCYGSTDFDGDMICLRSAGSTFGNDISCYDLINKGVWQKLIISPGCNSGEAPVHLYFNKQGVTDFSSLKGYVIFAYPQYKIIPKSDTCLSLMNSKNKSIFCEPEENDSIKNFHLNLCGSLNQNSDNKNICHVLLNSLIESILSLSKKSLGKFAFDNQKYEKAGLYGSHLPLISGIVKIKDNDPIRNLVTKFISEDTTYNGYKAKITLDTINNRFLGERIMRWQFAWQVFTREYNWTKKIFGGGFNFLNWYGYYFDGDKTKSDYPHNPFLHILLYSGILGLCLYVYLMYKVFYYYFKYIKGYYLFFIFFLMAYFFTFFSGGNPFDPPMMGFFVLFPFLINYVHTKDRRNFELIS